MKSEALGLLAGWFVVVAAAGYVAVKVRFRWWLLGGWLAKREWLFWTKKQRESLWHFHRTVQVATGAYWTLWATAAVLFALAVRYSWNTPRWGLFVQKDLAVVFFLGYLAVVGLAVLIWAANQWTLAPLLRCIAFVKVTDQADGSTPGAQPRKNELSLRPVLAVLLSTALVLFSLSNLFLTPFGKCNQQTHRCSLNVTVLSSDEQHDIEWPIAANWLFLTVNSIFVIISVFFADLYIHASTDLLVETHARVAESLMRYGVSLSSFTGPVEPGNAEEEGDEIDESEETENHDVGVLEMELDEADVSWMGLREDFKGNFSSEEMDGFEPFLEGGFYGVIRGEDVELVERLHRLGGMGNTDIENGERTQQTAHFLEREIHRFSQIISKVVWKKVANVQDLWRLGDVSSESDTSSRGNSDESSTVYSDPSSFSALQRASSTYSENGFVRISGSYLRKLIETYQRMMKMSFLTAYSLSVLVLLLHASVHTLFMSKTFLFFQTAAILLTDSMLLVKFSSSTYRKSRLKAGDSPANLGGIRATHLAIVLLLVRVVLVSVPSHSWYLGQAAMYAISGIYLMLMIIGDYLGSNSSQLFEEHRRQWDMFSNISSLKDFMAWAKLFIKVYAREIIFVIFSLYFGLLTWILSNSYYTQILQFATRTDSDGIIYVNFMDREIPQWKLGVLAFLIVLITVLLTVIVMFQKRLSVTASSDCSDTASNQSSLRSVSSTNWWLDKDPRSGVFPRFENRLRHSRAVLRTLFGVLFGVVAVLAVPFFTAWFISSDIVGDGSTLAFLGAVSTLLPACLAAVGLHYVWIVDDYTFWLTLKDCQSKEDRQYRMKRNIFMVGCTVFVVLCLLAFGLSLHFEVGARHGFPVVYKIVFPLSALSFLFGALSSDLWFNTLEVTKTLQIFTFFHISCWIVACFSEIASNKTGAEKYNVFIDALAIFFLFVPVLNMCIVSVLAFLDSGYKFTLLVKTSCVTTCLAMILFSSCVYSRHGILSGFVTLSACAASVIVASVWMRSKVLNAEKNQDRNESRKLFMGVGFTVVVLFTIGLWDILTLNSVLVAEFSEKLLGFSYVITLAVVVVVFMILWSFKEDQMFRLHAICRSPAASLLGIPCIVYKVEQKGGELHLDNNLTYAILSLLIGIQIVGHILAHTWDSNVGIVVGSISLCFMVIFALQQALIRSVQFRRNLLGLDRVNGLDKVFSEILKESVERCLQISQQAMMSSWLCGKRVRRRSRVGSQRDSRHGVDNSSTIEIDESEHVVVSSVKELKDYYSEVYRADRTMQMYSHDSVKYQALFHILFLMRVSQFRQRQLSRSSARMHVKSRDAHSAIALPHAFMQCPASNDFSSRNTEHRTFSQDSNATLNGSTDSLSVWEDVAFPARNSSLYEGWDTQDEDLCDLEEDAVWLRPQEILPVPLQPSLFSKNSKFDPAEVIQGDVGDCWLLSALSVAALYPHILDRVLLDKGLTTSGKYHVRLFLSGEWQDIFVDDQIPCARDRSIVYNAESKRWNIANIPPDGLVYFPFPLYCKSRHGTVLWPLILEKAFAKRAGSFESLAGGHVDQALVDLTGGFSQKFSLREDIELIMSGALWQRLLHCDKKGLLLVASSPAVDEAGNEELEDGAFSMDQNGIVHGHAYSIVQVEEQSDRKGVHRLLRLRDPWGVCHWVGGWSRYDFKRWSKRMKKKLNFNPEVDDGTFWICFEDFVVSFKWLYVCHLFDSSDFLHQSIRGHWGVDQHDISKPVRWQGPRDQFVLRILNRTKRAKDSRFVRVFVSITSEIPEGQECSFPFVSLMLINSGGTRVVDSRVFMKSIIASTGKYKDSRDLSFETKLPCNERTAYTLFASVFPASTQSSFLINLYCETDFELEEIPI